MCACSLESQTYPGVHQKDYDQQVEGGDSVPLLYSGETSPGVLHPLWGLQFWGSQREKDIDLLEWVQGKAMKMIRRLEQLFYEERLRELGQFSWEKRKLQRKLLVAFQYLKGAYERGGERHFTRSCSDRTRGRGFKLKEGRIRLDVTMRVVRYWHRFPREDVDAPSLKVFKAGLNGALSNLV